MVMNKGCQLIIDSSAYNQLFMHSLGFIYKNRVTLSKQSQNISKILYDSIANIIMNIRIIYVH